MKGFPTRAEWQQAIDAGFISNGATSSPDTIYLIKIANGNNTYPPLPADLHDYRYFIGGEEEDRHFADREFFDYLLDIIEERGWRMVRPLARRRAMTYYEAVRLAGWKFFNYRKAQVIGPDSSTDTPDKGTTE